MRARVCIVCIVSHRCAFVSCPIHKPRCPPPLFQQAMASHTDRPLASCSATSSFSWAMTVYFLVLCSYITVACSPVHVEKETAGRPASFLPLLESYNSDNLGTHFALTSTGNFFLYTSVTRKLHNPKARRLWLLFEAIATLSCPCAHRPLHSSIPASPNLVNVINQERNLVKDLVLPSWGKTEKEDLHHDQQQRHPKP
jgi:hypothetical protein